MRNSSATKNSRLLNPWALAVVAVTVGGLLWATYQREEVFQPDGGEPDAVSANYAELLLTAHPDDDHLRLQLIDLLIGLGDYTKARQHLDAWPKPVAQVQAYYRLELDALEAADDQDTATRDALVKRLEDFDHRQLSLAQLQSLAKLALTLQAPAFAATVFEEIAERDPKQRNEALKSAAQWHLAGEQPGKAADIYLQLSKDSQAAEHREYAHLAFSSLLAADRGAEAAQVLADELDQLQNPDTDAPWIEQGVDVAMGNKRYDLVQRFIEQWRMLQPDNPRILRKDFNVRLAMNDLEGAWTSGQQLVLDFPEDQALLEQMAQLGEWRGDIQAALDYWMKLLALHEDPEVREHAWRLAIAQFDFDHAIPLLEGIARHRALEDDELDAVTYAHESRGTPELAETWLHSYVRKYPKHRLAWSRLLQNLENTGQYAVKARVYKDYAKRFTLTIPERIDWAGTHLKLFDNQAAWSVLQVKNRDKIKDKDYWTTRAALAWDLELDDELRASLEKLLAIKGSLNSNDESHLIAGYRLSNPQRALELLVDSWQRTRNPIRLVDALLLAQDLDDWAKVSELLKEAEQDPAIFEEDQVLGVRGALAMHEGQPEEAKRLYLLGLAKYPDENLFRERLMWLYVDQGNTAELKPLVTQWKARARNDQVLWLAFASANQLLGRSSESLAWYRLYIKNTPNDWLVQAAYADALYDAGYQDAAQRLRLKLLRSPEAENAQPSKERYTTWLRLMSSSYSPRKAQQELAKRQDGSPMMLQLWFDRLLARLDATNQESQKDVWLDWAKSQGLKVDRYEQIQQALRSRNKAQVETLLASSDLNPAQRAQALSRLGRVNEALDTNLEALGDDQPESVQEQLRRQAVEIHEGTPQGALLSWQDQDYGGIAFDAPRLEIAHNIGDNWYADLELEQGTYDGDDVIGSRIGTERNAALTLTRSVENGSYKLFADTSQRKDDDRNGLGLSRAWQLGASDELETGVDWHRKTDDSGLMRAFGRQDRLWLGGRHSFSARDQFSWEVAKRSFSTRAGDDLGNGEALKAEFNHTLEFAGPNWTVRSGLDYQHNRVNDKPLNDLSSDYGGAVKVPTLIPDPVEIDPDTGLPEPAAPVELQTITGRDLLQSRYGQLYVGSTWRRGIPGALVRTKPQYTWLVDVTAGWQWLDQTFNYGLNTGIGFEVLGDDELALTLGYQSAPQGGDGKAGGTLGVSYGVRFGR